MLSLELLFLVIPFSLGLTLLLLSSSGQQIKEMKLKRLFLAWFNFSTATLMLWTVTSSLCSAIGLPERALSCEITAVSGVTIVAYFITWGAQQIWPQFPSLKGIGVLGIAILAASVAPLFWFIS